MTAADDLLNVIREDLEQEGMQFLADPGSRIEEAVRLALAPESFSLLYGDTESDFMSLDEVDKLLASVLSKARRRARWMIVKRKVQVSFHVHGTNH